MNAVSASDPYTNTLIPISVDLMISQIMLL